MPAMTKRVNIKANVAVRTINPPIYGTVRDVVMTTGDILKCLCKRAQVEEILPDGSTVKLTMKNYFTDNGAGLFVNKNEPKKAPEAPVVIEAPVVETTLEVPEEVIPVTEEEPEEVIPPVEEEPVVVEQEEVQPVQEEVEVKSSKKKNKKKGKKQNEEVTSEPVEEVESSDPDWEDK